MSIIETHDLSKVFRTPIRRPGIWGAVTGLFAREYKSIHAVNNINLSIEPGELVGYIGPNGAGKSTTVKMLCGILIPSSGTTRVMGRDPYRHRIENAREIGVLFGQRSKLMGYRKAVGETYELFRLIYEVEDATFRRNFAECREALGLDEFLDVPVHTLSLGQRMRANLAAALLHGPKVIYLDEPTIGLDVNARIAVRGYLRFLNQERGTTILFTSHDLTEIEDLCKRIVIIDRGTIIYDGALDALRRRVIGQRSLVFELRSPQEACRKIQQEVAARYAGLGVDCQCEDGRVRVTFDRDALSAAQLTAEVMGLVEVTDLAVEEPPIEQVIKKIYDEGIPS